MFVRVVSIKSIAWSLLPNGARVSILFTQWLLVSMLQVGGKLPPSSISGSMPARDEIPTVFVRKFFCHTNASPSGTSSLVNTRWRAETGSSYKLVRGRDINVMSAATIQFSVMPDSLPQVPTSSDFWEQQQVQIGSRNSTQNRKY